MNKAEDKYIKLLLEKEAVYFALASDFENLKQASSLEINSLKNEIILLQDKFSLVTHSRFWIIRNFIARLVGKEVIK